MSRAFPDMIKRTFEEHLLMGRLPSSPGVARLLVDLARRKGSAPAEVAGAIRKDPALTARLLERARLLPRSGDAPLETVEAAIDLLGPRGLLLAVRELSLVTVGGTRRCPGFDYERYWTVSLGRAIAAEVIVRSTGRNSPGSAYTLGLLADIGCLALASVYPAEYSDVLAACKSGDRSALAQLERDRLEIDHASVGASLFERWGLRRSFARAVCLFEDEEEAADTEGAEALDLSEVLRCAQILAEECAENRAGDGVSAVDRSSAQLQELLGLPEEAARRIRAVVARLLLEQMSAAPSSTGGEESSAGNGAAPQVLDSEKEQAAEQPIAAQLTSVPLAADPDTAGPSSAEQPTPEKPDARGSSPRAGLRILAVDDDPTSLAILRRVLEQDGHEVRCASNGTDALEIALEQKLQAVVADWMMPRMDGIELCKALRCIQSGRELFFLLLTGQDQEDQVVEAYDAGVDEYVTKPFNPRILLARLRAGQRVMELKAEVDAEQQIIEDQVRQLGLLNRKLQTAAMTDQLTGLNNRRYVYQHLAEEWQNSTRTVAPLAVMMIDIDHFKRVNDENGHEIGDLVLKQVAQVLQNKVRQSEQVARLGGEEFLVVWPNSTAAQAKVGAERLRKAVETQVIQAAGFAGSVTVSIGVAERTREMSGVDALLKAADTAVYAAKSAGRNQVKLAESADGKALSA